MNTAPCPHCGVSFMHRRYFDLHVDKCPLDPKRRAAMLQLLDSDDDGFICTQAEYDAKRPEEDSLSSNGITKLYQSWGAFASKFGLFVGKAHRTYHDPLNEPLTWHERNACKLRGNVEFQP